MSKLEDMKTCNDLIAKHGSALQRALSELESMEIVSDHGSKAKVVNERATMFRITSLPIFSYKFHIKQHFQFFSPPEVIFGQF
jgi:hypothetical protein